MAVDKDLFLYDLAIVAIMKNEGHYVKEWIDYHLLAGVNHFYIYDNESTDNFKEVLQPYIDAGVVTYIFWPGKAMQQPAYNDAVQKYRFFCRYMAFVDGDEFIAPQKTEKSIVEVVDEILEGKSTAGGLVLNWLTFGSNFQEKADYSRGVLERFTRHKNKIENSIKTIANPRKVEYFFTPHYATYFVGCYQIDEISLHWFPNSDYKISGKILMHHYYAKSHEEYTKKAARGEASYGDDNWYTPDKFNHENNDILDDSILKYRDARYYSGGGIIKKTNYQKCYNALVRNLVPAFSKNVSKEIFTDKMETFLTCRKLAEHMRENILDENAGRFFEEAALNAIHKTLSTSLNFFDIQLLLQEMPNILPLNYPAVKNIRSFCINILSKVKTLIRKSINEPEKIMRWKDFIEYDYLMKMLQTFDNYEHPKLRS